MQARTIIIALALAMATNTVANATGFPPTDFIWTGFYVGGHAGWGEARFKNLFFYNPSNEHPEPEGWLGGVQAGYNHQWGMWVLGIEGDVSFLDETDTAFDRGQIRSAADSVRVDVDTLATLRVRGGPTFGRFFVFGTVGAAWTDAKWTACDCNDTRDKITLNFDDVGVAYGGGVEVALANRWSIKGEGLVFDFDDQKRFKTRLFEGPNRRDTFPEFSHVIVWRVAVNYRFGR